MTDPKLKSLVERIERLEEERKAIGGDVKDIYTEAKGVGYDAPALRRLVSWRRLDAADRAEREALDETYRNALGMAVEMVSNGDMSLRQAAKATGVSKSSIHKALAVHEVSTDHREMAEEDLGDPLWVVDRDRAKFKEKVRAIAATVKVPALSDDEVIALAEAATAAIDDLTIPSFLKRERVA